ncbi:hypothetical protein MNQ95_12235 [Pseudoxanthomonas daejeonensis]|uniref:hypothetical protein n=1 Tax=Pseudoxanthomonas daejeonensis TaxID=266062 RepID=UPI001F541EDE|nr:hypothetical protein [Pseudoxanthomonas daejeonensis]UNK56906.1 hypothetical protein MNQ95_12235 [Pseudoxanthomonas daejeonensis]
MSDLPYPAASTRTSPRRALVVMALMAMLLAWNLLGPAEDGAHARIAVRNAAGLIAVGVQPGDGAPPESLHHPAERKKPRQFELAVASQLDATLSAPPSSAGIAWTSGSDAPVADIVSAVCIADTEQLPPASADAGRLRLHPSQAPPSA